MRLPGERLYDLIIPVHEEPDPPGVQISRDPIGTRRDDLGLEAPRQNHLYGGVSLEPNQGRGQFAALPETRLEVLMPPPLQAWLLLLGAVHSSDSLDTGLRQMSACYEPRGLAAD